MSETLALTKNQRKAVTALNRSVLVSAEAGSGETEILVERLCRILEKRLAAIDEVLIVAPTEMAAAEIRERAAQRLAAESAQIGTIHGFCSRVLRENAFEAGVDPWFSVLGDVRQRVMAGRLLDEAVEAMQRHPATASFLQEVGADAVRDAMRSISRRIRAARRAPSEESAAPPSDPVPFLEMFGRCYHELMSFAESSDDVPAKLVSDAERGLASAMASAQRLVASREGSGFDWADFRRVSRYRGRFTLSRVYAPAARQQVLATRAALYDFLAACLDGLSSRYASLLLDLVADFRDRYSSAKERLGLLDYDDLLYRTRELFYNSDGSPSDMARRYRDRFRFVMLAGAQDVSSLQREILDAVSRPRSLFAVGDDKQSVFSFMHGDAGRDERDGRRHNGRALSVSLRDNFRSRRRIVDFINYFFGEVWAEDADVEYEGLKCAGEFAAKSEPDVEIVLVPRVYERLTDGSIAERGRRDEAGALAQRILEMTGRAGADPLLHTKQGRAGRPVELRDIVVLLRSARDVSVYGDVLEDHGIHTHVVSGRGFSGTPEVQDVLRLLSVVDQPLDDIAMAAVLRSPFAGISEDALVSVCSGGLADGGAPPTPDERPGRLWRALRRLDGLQDLEETDRLKLSAFREMLSDLVSVSFRLTAADVLDLALERSAFGTRLLAMRGGRRKYANMCELRDIASELQAGGLFGLPDFIAHVQELERVADRETAAAAEGEQQDAVRIMTIHRVSGLQSPVVFVAGMSRGLRARPGPFVFDPDRGLAAQVVNPSTGKLETPLCHREIAEDLRDQVMSEQKRLLYVAVTRAEEHLVLVGGSDLRGEYRSTYRETGSWTGWLEKAFELGPGTPQGELSVGGCTAKLSFGPPRRVKPSEVPEPSTLAGRFGSELREGRPIEGMDIPPAAFEAARNAIERCAAVEAPEGCRRLSVSRALDYLECPARYRLLHVIGMPEEGGEPPEDAEEAGFAAADLGHLVHDLLASVDFSQEVEPQLRTLISAVRDDALRTRAEPLLDGFAAGHWRRELRAADRVLKETPFELMIGGTVLAGRMDVLYRGTDGWTVLDYKTGRAESRERYELQVGIYAHATSRLLGEMPSRAVLLLLSTGEEWVQHTSDGSVAQLAAEEICRVAAAIEAGRFDPTPGEHCRWCSLSSRCGQAKP